MVVSRWSQKSQTLVPLKPGGSRAGQQVEPEVTYRTRPVDQVGLSATESRRDNRSPSRSFWRRPLSPGMVKRGMQIWVIYVPFRCGAGRLNRHLVMLR